MTAQNNVNERVSSLVMTCRQRPRDRPSSIGLLEACDKIRLVVTCQGFTEFVPDSPKAFCRDGLRLFARNGRIVDGPTASSEEGRGIHWHDVFAARIVLGNNYNKKNK